MFLPERLPDGSRILAVRRPEDAVWYAERIRRDGLVDDWAYAPTLPDALDGLAAASGGNCTRKRFLGHCALP